MTTLPVPIVKLRVHFSEEEEFADTAPGLCVVTLHVLVYSESLFSRDEAAFPHPWTVTAAVQGGRVLVAEEPPVFATGGRLELKRPPHVCSPRPKAELALASLCAFTFLPAQSSPWQLYWIVSLGSHDV